MHRRKCRWEVHSDIDSRQAGNHQAVYQQELAAAWACPEQGPRESKFEGGGIAGESTGPVLEIAPAYIEYGVKSCRRIGKWSRTVGKHMGNRARNHDCHQRGAAPGRKDGATLRSTT